MVSVEIDALSTSTSFGVNIELELAGVAFSGVVGIGCMVISVFTGVNCMVVVDMLEGIIGGVIFGVSGFVIGCVFGIVTGCITGGCFGDVIGAIGGVIGVAGGIIGVGDVDTVGEELEIEVGVEYCTLGVVDCIVDVVVGEVGKGDCVVETESDFTVALGA